MNKIKALEERKNTIKEKMNSLVDVMEKETRSLSEVENKVFEDYKEEVRKLNEEIDQIKEEVREGSTKIKGEKREMENKNVEIRAFEQYLRGKNGEEVRKLNQTADGKAVIPENVEGMIVEKLVEYSDVFGESRKFPSQSGSLKIAKENTESSAGFVGEGEDLNLLTLDLGEATLTQKRVGNAIALSKQLINDSAVDIVGYSMERLAKGVASAIEKSAINGTGGTKGFAGVLADEDVAEIKATEITIDVIMDLYTALHPSLLGNAKFRMNRETFNQVAKLKDGNGHFYIQNGVINGVPTYTLLGVEVLITDALPKENPILFGSFYDGYAIMVKKGMELQHIIADTTQAMRGSQLLVLDGYMDGTVYNPQAFVKLTAGAGE